MKVLILRGISGSGKSKLTGMLQRTAEELKVRAWVASADHYFKDRPFAVTELDAAHRQCLLNALGVLSNYRDGLLIVDNTNIHAWEAAPYYQLALAFDHRPRILRVHSSFEVACRRCTHDVPLERIWAMHSALLSERLPWPESFILNDAGFSNLDLERLVL